MSRRECRLHSENEGEGCSTFALQDMVWPLGIRRGFWSHAVVVSAAVSGAVTLSG